MECQFSNPFYWNNIAKQLMPLDETVARLDAWNYSTMICTNDNLDQYTFQQYVNPTNGANFYLQKSLSYGDILVIFFLVFCFVAIVFKLIWNFNFNKSDSKL